MRLDCDCGIAIGPCDWHGFGIGIDLVQPRGQSDAARNGIEFGHRGTVVGEDEIGPDHAGHVVLQRGRALEFDEFGRFAEIEPAGDPFRLFAFDALAVKQIDGAIKLQQHAAEGFEIFGQRRLEPERGRGHAPFVSGEQPAAWHPAADKTRGFRGGRRCDIG